MKYNNKKSIIIKTPVKTQFGYHVIYLKDKFPSKTFAYTEVEKNINQVLIGNALNKKISRFLFIIVYSLVKLKVIYTAVNIGTILIIQPI